MTDQSAPVLVLDTNVLIAALLSPHGPPAAILRMLLAGHARLAYDARILVEDREVAAGPKFNLELGLVEAVLDALATDGLSVTSTPLPGRLPDPDDEPFLEAAIAVGPDTVLVTGNVQHFPSDPRHGVEVLTPRQWLEYWRRRVQPDSAGNS